MTPSTLRAATEPPPVRSSSWRTALAWLRRTRDGFHRPRWWLEALVLVWLLWAYDAITNLPARREHAALAHGWAVLHLEQRLHLDPEHGLNRWLDHHHLLGLLAGDYYDNLHFIVTLGIVGWLWWRHPRRYRPLRTALVLINVIGFAVYWVYPMAPPRLLPGQHFADIVALTHAVGGWHSGTLSKAANQYAAMPSLHLAWAFWSALAVWTVFRGRRWVNAVWLYPAATTVVVMATGNHFLSDCVAGVATAAVSALAAGCLARLMARRRGQGGDGERDDGQVGDGPPEGRVAAVGADPAARASFSAPTGVVRTPSAGNTAQTTKAPA